MLARMIRSLPILVTGSSLHTYAPVVHLAGRTSAVWRSKSTLSGSGSSGTIQAREDRYEGLIIDSELLPLDPATFAKQLTTSLQVSLQQTDCTSGPPPTPPPLPISPIPFVNGLHYATPLQCHKEGFSVVGLGHSELRFQEHSVGKYSTLQKNVGVVEGEG